MKKVDVFPVYVPKYDNLYAVDAVTGDKIRTGRYGIYGGAGDMAADRALMMEKENVKKQRVSQKSQSSLRKKSRRLKTGRAYNWKRS